MRNMEPTSFFVGIYFLVSLINLTTSKINNYGGWSSSPDTQYHIQTDEGEERYFKYQTKSGQYRKEKRLEDGTVVGTYGWVDPNGYLRLRDYVADNQGYRIVKTKMIYVGDNSLIPESTPGTFHTKFSPSGLPSITFQAPFQSPSHRFGPYVPPPSYVSSPSNSYLSPAPISYAPPAYDSYVPSASNSYVPSDSNSYVPSTPSPYISSTSSPYASSTPSPYDSSTPSPYASPISSPYVFSTSSPYASSTPSPYASSTSSPYVSSTPSPYASSTSSPYVSSTPSPYASSTSSPYASSTSSPYASSTSSPYASSTSGPYASSTPGPHISSTPSTYDSSTPSTYPSSTGKIYFSPSSYEGKYYDNNEVSTPVFLPSSKAGYPQIYPSNPPSVEFSPNVYPGSSISGYVASTYPNVAIIQDSTVKPSASYATSSRPFHYATTPSPISYSPTTSSYEGLSSTSVPVSSTPSPVTAIGVISSTTPPPPPPPISGKFAVPLSGNNNFITETEKNKLFFQHEDKLNNYYRKRYIDNRNEYQEYDGIATVQNGFRYYLPRHYHEEAMSHDGEERAGSFGYIDPFGIRRVIYYNTAPGRGFIHRKNNRYVGFDATPYDPRPTP